MTSISGQDSSSLFIPAQHEYDCKKCPLWSGRKHIVPSYLPRSARVLFVAQAPGKHEDASGTQPLIGPSGRLWETALNEVGIARQYVGIANICRCWPPKDREPTKQEMGACLPYLHREIEMLKPDLIVVMGGIALSQFGVSGGINKWRGKLLKAKPFDIPMLPTFHPSFVDRQKHRPEVVKYFHDDLDMVLKILNGQELTETKKPTFYKIVDTIGDFREMMRYLNSQSIVSVDTETRTWDFLEKEALLCMSFSAQPCTGLVVPLKRHIDNSTFNNSVVDVFTPQEKHEIVGALRDLFANPKITKVLQNYSFDQLFLTADGMPFPNDPVDIEDTMLMHHVYDPESPHDLKTLAYLYSDMGEYDTELNSLRTEAAKVLGRNKESVSFDFLPDNKLWHYSAADADATIRVYQYLKPMLQKEGLWDVYRNYQMPTRWVLNDVEREGVSIDIPALDALLPVYKKKVEDKLQEIQLHPEIVKFCGGKRGKIVEERKATFVAKINTRKTYARQKGYAPEKLNNDEWTALWIRYGEEAPPFLFNPGSHPQLKELIIDQLRLPIVKKTATGGPSFDDEAIQTYVEKYNHPFMSLLSDYRSLVGFNSTWITGLREKVSSDGKIRTDYLVHGTGTSRLSSRDPSLHTCPRDAYDVQHVFVADPGCWWVAIDWKQAEFRCPKEGSKILMKDFSYRPIQDVKVGDEVWSVEETPVGPYGRRIRLATVVGVWDRGEKECVTISSGENSVVITPDHKFLRTYDEGNGARWKPLKSGDSCYQFPVTPIVNRDQYLRGMVYGLYLTDGSLHSTGGNGFCWDISQNDTEVLGFVHKLLEGQGYVIHLHKDTVTMGVLSSIERFLVEYGTEKNTDDDYKRGVVAGAILGDGWIGKGTKTSTQIELGIGLSIVHPEVVQIVHDTLDELSKRHPFTFNVYNTPYKEDAEKKAFFTFEISSTGMFVFPQLIPGKKSDRFTDRIVEIMKVGNFTKYDKVVVTPLLGKHHVYDLTTTTGTFICENFVVHNCWGDFSKDPQMLRDINAGHDIHKLVAALGAGVQMPTGDISKELFKELVKNVTKAMRQVAKDVVFGVMYGRSAQSVAKQLGITTQQAQLILNAFFARYPQAAQWIQDTIRKAHQSGCTYSLFGFRRKYPNINSANEQERAASEREVTNMPIQSTVTQIVNGIAAPHAKMGIDQLKRENKIGRVTRQILTIHDALYYNIPNDDLKLAMRTIMTEIKREVPGFSVRLDVEVKIGESWDTSTEMSDEEVAELIVVV